MFLVDHTVYNNGSFQYTGPNMTTLESQPTSQFNTGQVLTIVGGHFVHDIFTAFVAPLLPLIIENLSISLTLAGALTAIMQLPSILNPFIGHLADRISVRHFVIWAPAITATAIGLIGIAPTYTALAVLLFISGISSAIFHSPAPAMVAQISGSSVGKGMSWFMAAGELGRSLGPLMAVGTVSILGFEGLPRLIVLGWGMSLVLLWRLQKVSGGSSAPGSLRLLIPLLRTVFLPLLFINLFRLMLIVALSVYLPTFLSMEGNSLVFAGIALSILELAGVGGALLSGTLSDRLGRKPILLITSLVSSLLMLLFIEVPQGWWTIPLLILLGFTALSSAPVMMAIVQDHAPNNRAAGNGLYMSINFLLRSGILVLIGAFGDKVGLRTTFFWIAIISFLAIPAILTLPGKLKEDRE